MNATNRKGDFRNQQTIFQQQSSSWLHICQSYTMLHICRTICVYNETKYTGLVYNETKYIGFAQTTQWYQFAEQSVCI